MRKHEDVNDIARKLLEPGYVFEAHESNLIPLRIRRGIGKDEAIDVLPALKSIYSLILEGKSQKASELVSELTSLLLAAELGIAQEFLIELRVRQSLPKLNRDIKRMLKKATQGKDLPRGTDKLV